MLPRQTLTRDSICKGLGSISPRLAEVTHEKRHISPVNKRGGGDKFRKGQRHVEKKREIRENGKYQQILAKTCIASKQLYSFEVRYSSKQKNVTLGLT